METIRWISFFLFGSALLSVTEITLPSIIGSNMVLQQKSTAAI